MLENRHLVTFDAVLRQGTFAAAARELGYTQPGVSQQMRALERELNATLFVRDGRGLTLSEQGEALAARVPGLLAELRSTHERVQAVSRLRAGRVRVCAFPSANAVLVPAALSRMRSQNQGVDVELFEAEPPESLQGLEQGTYDLVVSFRYADPTPLPHGMATVELMREPLVLLLPQGHPLNRRQYVELGELREERWVAGCVRCRQEFFQACHDAGFEPRVDFTTDDNLAVQSYVVSGLGLAVVPQMVQSFVRHPRLRTRPISPSRTRVVTATMLASPRQPPALRQMLASLTWAAERLTHHGDI